MHPNSTYNNSGESFEEVIPGASLDKITQFAITEPEFDWDDHRCAKPCDAGRFCTVAWNMQNRKKHSMSVQELQQKSSKGICICGDKLQCSDTNSTLNCDLACGNNCASCSRNDELILYAHA